MLMDRRGRECLHPPSYLRGLLKYTPRKASQQMQLCLGRPCHRLNWRIGFQWRRSVWEGVNMPDCLTVPSLITFSPHSMPAPSQVISSGFTPLRKDVLSARALFMRHHPKSAPAPSPPPFHLCTSPTHEQHAPVINVIPTEDGQSLVYLSPIIFFVSWDGDRDLVWQVLRNEPIQTPILFLPRKTFISTSCMRPKANLATCPEGQQSSYQTVIQDIWSVTWNVETAKKLLPLLEISFVDRSQFTANQDRQALWRYDLKLEF